MRASWRSDIGKIRENNEDSVLADVEEGIFLLADGMGGCAGGEIASDLAVTAAYEHLLGRVGSTAQDTIPRLLAEALASAHSAVSKKSLLEPALAGMGTTLEIMVVKNDVVSLCHVGDSRIYLMRKGELQQLTTDDNLAAVLVKEKHVPPQEVPTNASHILTQAVGVSDSLIPEIRVIELREKDLLVICSDGLTGMLTDREIAIALRKSQVDLEKASEILVMEANARGGIDNISVLLVEPQPPSIFPQVPPMLEHSSSL